jgi:2-oxoglutarate dehydrogenase E1 component
MYEAYLDNPGSVPDNWRAYFDALQHVPPPTARMPATWPMRPSSNPSRARQGQCLRCKASASELAVARKQVHVQSLIAAYRSLGALGRPRPAQARRAPQDSRAGAGVLRPDRVRHGHLRSTPANTYFGTAEQQTLRDPAGAA